MNIRGLSPAVKIGGRPFQFDLRPRDALAWQSLERLDRSAQIEFLAASPEALAVCCVSVNARDSDSKDGQDISLDSLLEHLGFTSAKDQASDVSQLVVLDRASKTNYFRCLSGEKSSVSCSDIQSTFQRLVIDVGGLNETETKEWQAVCRLPNEVWNQLSAASKNSTQKQTIRIRPESFGHESGNESGNVCGAAGEDFERKLHLAKMASMKQLAYGASHEINNPLANIASRAQTLLMDETDPGRRLKLAKINEQAFRAHEMIADMMLFAHPPQPEFVLTDATEVLQQVLEEIQPIAERQDTVVELQTTGSSISGEFDRVQLAVAVKALIQNSLESLQESGSVQVHLSSPDKKSLMVTVSDDGPGITSESMKHLFDPFYSGREAGRGLGFGLSKAWRIAELHGGEISAESPSHGGAQFCLRIPYRDVA